MSKYFNEHEQQVLEEIIYHRRDVRGNLFVDKEVSDDDIDKLLFSALNAPSVGFSQPWEFVIIRDQKVKEQIKASYRTENDKASTVFADRPEYQRLKLEGITEAPVNIAVFYKPSNGPVLGQTSMQEVGLYSVVCAVQNLWLMARAQNLGVGWVSILDEQRVKKILNAPSENQLVAYLCVGHVSQFLDKPELETLCWEERKPAEAVVFYDGYISSNGDMTD